MKNATLTRAIAASILGLASLSAFAQSSAVTDANYPGPSSLQSSLSRAQVVAELAQAKAAGQVIDGDAYPGFAAPGAGPASTVSRAQVETELRQARASGQLIDGEGYPGPIVASSTKTREQVRAELAQYKAAGYAFNDATYPVPARSQPRQATQHVNRVASSGATSTYLP